MDWTPLASSNLNALRYDEVERVLQIRFNSGRTYSYKDVPPDVAEGLSTAGSPGSFFHSNIRGVYSET